MCYPSERSRLNQQRVCEAKVYDNCRRAARKGCSLAALSGFKRRAMAARVGHLVERLACAVGWRSSRWAEESAVRNESPEAAQDRIMTACMAQADTKCQEHSAVFCERIYRSESL